MPVQDIEMNVGLNTSQAVKDSKNLNKELNAIFKVTGDQQLSSKIQGITNRLEKQQYALQKTTEKIRQLSNEKVPTEEFTELSKESETLMQKITRLNEKMHDVKLGTPEGAEQFKKMDAELQGLEQRLMTVRYSIGQLFATGQAFTFADNNEQIDELNTKVHFLNNGIERNIKSLYEADNSIAEMVYHSDELTDAIGNTASSSKWVAEGFHEATTAEQESTTAIGNADTQLAQFIATSTQLNSVKRVINTITTVFRTLEEIAKEVTATVLKLAKSGFKRLGSAIKGVALRMHGLNKESNKHELSLKRIVNTMLKYGLGIRSVFILWRKLRAYAQDALKLMAQHFEEIDATVSDIVNSFNQFKNSVGTAVQPLMTAFAPALTAILGLLTDVNTALANFFAIFTGQKYIYKAKKSNDSYAKSLENVSNSAADANEDIASYDKLLVINKDKGSGSRSGDGDADEMVDAFEKTLAESEFAEQLKAAIKAGDWEGVGALFADKLNIINRTLDAWILEFRPKAVQWAENVARILNGAVDTAEWDKYGKTIGDSINTVLDTANTFLVTFDFNTLGAGVGTTINEAFDTTDWNLLGETLANKINAMFDTAKGLVTTLKWKDIGTDLGTAVKSYFENLHWSDYSFTISTSINGLVDLVNGFLTTPDWGDTAYNFGKSITDTIAGIDWNDFADVLNNIVDALIDALCGFIAGFSLTDVITAFGDLLDGLELDTIAVIAGAITLKASASVLSAAISNLNASLTTMLGHSPMTIGISVVLAATIGFKVGKKVYEWATGEEAPEGGIVSYLEEIIGSWFGDDKVEFNLGDFLEFGFGDDDSPIKSFWDSIANSSFMSFVMGDTEDSNLFTNIRDGWAEIGNDIVEGLKKGFGNLKEKFKGKWEEFKQGFSEKVGTLKSTIKAVKDKAYDKVVGAYNAVKNSTVVKTIKAKKDKAFDTVKNAWNAIKSGAVTKTIKAKKDKAFDSVKKAWDAIKSGTVTKTVKAKAAAGFALLKAKWDALKSKTLDLKMNLATKWADFKQTIKDFINNIIDFINKNLVGKINDFFKIKIPSNDITKFMGIAGKSASIIKLPEIPELAQGAVIPPNKEFLAMLGDQKSGVNIETPLDTMIDAFTTALDSREGAGDNKQPIVLQLDGKTIAQVVWNASEKKYKQTGKYTPRYI